MGETEGKQPDRSSSQGSGGKERVCGSKTIISPSMALLLVLLLHALSTSPSFSFLPSSLAFIILSVCKDTCFCCACLCLSMYALLSRKREGLPAATHVY